MGHYLEDLVNMDMTYPSSTLAPSRTRLSIGSYRVKLYNARPHTTMPPPGLVRPFLEGIVSTQWIPSPTVVTASATTGLLVSKIPL
jgi:hypothetical protein